MNNFVSPNSTADSKVPRHLETLATTVFQSLFPPINPQATPLRSIKRVLLVNREQDTDGTFILNFRHYAITTRATGMSRAVRRLRAAEKLAAQSGNRLAVPNLGRLTDIADYMIGGETGDGYATDVTSGSELDTDNEVEVLEPTRRKIVPNRNNNGNNNTNNNNNNNNESIVGQGNAADDDDDDGTVERRAVKLVELGPRMRLRLTKVEDGLCAGRVMWHEYVRKSAAEAKELDRRWEKRRQEKEARRREQKENVERKRKEKEARKGGGAGDGMDVDVGGESEGDDYSQSGSDFDEVEAANGDGMDEEEDG